MSIFGSIGNFFKKLFKKLRPGLDGFLQEYKQLGVDEVIRLSQVHGKDGFHHWKDEAWQNVQDKLAKDGKKIAGNWVSILLSFAYEELKGELLDKDKK